MQLFHAELHFFGESASALPVLLCDWLWSTARKPIAMPLALRNGILVKHACHSKSALIAPAASRCHPADLSTRCALSCSTTEAHVSAGVVLVLRSAPSCCILLYTLLVRGRLPSCPTLPPPSGPIPAAHLVASRLLSLSSCSGERAPNRARIASFADGASCRSFWGVPPRPRKRLTSRSPQPDRQHRRRACLAGRCACA